MILPSVFHDPTLATIQEVSSPSDESGGDLTTIRTVATTTTGETLSAYNSEHVGRSGNHSFNTDGMQQSTGFAVAEDGAMSQREIVEQRLRKKGVRIYSDEEARKILEQAKSDLQWMQDSGRTPKDPPGQTAGKKTGHTSKGKRVKGKREQNGKG